MWAVLFYVVWDLRCAVLLWAKRVGNLHVEEIAGTAGGAIKKIGNLLQAKGADTYFIWIFEMCICFIYLTA